MKFFNLGRHISLSCDFIDIIKKMGHEIDVETQSHHSFIVGMKRAEIPLIEDINSIMKSSIGEDFFKEYGSKLSQYDSYIVDYPPSYSILFEKFNKPVIVYIAIRYEYPFSLHKDKWEQFNEYLIKGVDTGKIILCANSRYDQEYTKGFLNRPVEYIPNLCSYTMCKYTYNNGPFLYSSKEHIPEIPSHVKWRERDLSSFYTWQHLYGNFRAIIIIPYQVSTMSIFEHYTANMPMLFPTKDFLKKLYKSNIALKEMHWNRYLKGKSKSIVPFTGFCDPNDYEDIESVSYWVNFADYYNEEWFPHIVYFESYSHLEHILHNTDFNSISENMKQFNIGREAKIKSMWGKLIKSIQL